MQPANFRESFNIEQTHHTHREKNWPKNYETYIDDFSGNPVDGIITHIKSQNPRKNYTKDSTVDCIALKSNSHFCLRLVTCHIGVMVQVVPPQKILFEHFFKHFQIYAHDKA